MNSTGRTLLRLALAATLVCPALLAESPAPTPASRAAIVADVRRQLRSDSMRPPMATQFDPKLQAAIKKVEGPWVFPGPKQQPPPPPEDPETQPSPPEPPKPTGPLTAPVLKQMAARAPKDMADPIALADSLFLAGQLETAYAVYESALAALKDPAQRAWAIFQMANSRRGFDPAGCRPIYQRLLTEHPGSPWIAVARTCDLLTEWYRINKPVELLTEAELSAGTK